MKILILSLLLYGGAVQAEQPNIKSFIDKYVDASLRADLNSLASLFHDVWDECRVPEHNKMMKSHFIETISDINFQLEYTYELFPITSNSEQRTEEADIYSGIEDAEYYPEEPSHELRITQRSGNFTTTYSFPIINVEGKWYFVHACAGSGMKKYLRNISASE